MEKFIVEGGNTLNGEINLSGAKNVALKIPVTALLTDEEIVIHNIPLIKDVFFLLDVLKTLGVKIQITNHTLHLKGGSLKSTSVPLEMGARLRSSSLVLGPILARYGQARVPNPGGCRIGARPIDRHIEALRMMGAQITYNSTDGYFYAKAGQLNGTTIVFPKNTHTGTETIILAAVLAQGRTIIENAAQEVEIDDLISCLNRMGAKIKRIAPRRIAIDGVSRLHGTEYSIMHDRNEEATFAIAAAVSHGNITVNHSQRKYLAAFLEVFKKAGGQAKAIDEDTTSYSCQPDLKAVDVTTSPYPGFMTDWQAPWSVLMTQSRGQSIIHETVFESRFSYVSELRKMGANIEFYDPKIADPVKYYNFNWNDRLQGYHQAVKIYGPTKLHNAIVEIDDLRAGATLVLAALTAPGTSYIYGVPQIDRGYEKIEDRLRLLGANITRVKEES